MAPISIFIILACLLRLRAHFSTKFTKLSIVWQFSTIMSIFKKKSFSVMYHIGGIPGLRKIFFLEKSFTPKFSQVVFLNIFSKFQKEVLEGICRHVQVHGLRNVGEEQTLPVGLTEAYLTILRIVPVRKTRLFFATLQ